MQNELQAQTHPYSYHIELALPAPVVLPLMLASSAGFSSTAGAVLFVYNRGGNAGLS